MPNVCAGLLSMMYTVTLATSQYTACILRYCAQYTACILRCSQYAAFISWCAQYTAFTRFRRFASGCRRRRPGSVVQLCSDRNSDGQLLSPPPLLLLLLFDVAIAPTVIIVVIVGVLRLCACCNRLQPLLLLLLLLLILLILSLLLPCKLSSLCKWLLALEFYRLIHNVHDVTMISCVIYIT